MELAIAVVVDGAGVTGSLAGGVVEEAVRAQLFLRSASKLSV
jgi:hypothetical protein